MQSPKDRTMLHRLRTLTASLRNAFSRRQPPDTFDAADTPAVATPALRRALLPLVALTAATALGYGLVMHPPVLAVPHGQVALRTNQFSGGTTEFRTGSFLRIPGLHETRLLPVRDQSYHPAALAKASGPAPLQSVEGLSLGLDLTVRWGLDAARLPELARKLPEDIEGEVIAPAVQAVVYKQVAKRTVREIFSSQRAEIAAALEAELRARLAVDGIQLKSVQIGSVDLPADYRRGMDSLLADSLASERMRYTLEIADKKVKETELQAAAHKVRRETAAEAAAREQIIAAKAQEEAMKHVLPFKQKLIEQRALEAQADSAARIQQAEGAAKARRIEIDAEAAARQKLADAEAYRVAQVGKANAGQMATEGALLTKHPLLVQKAMADKLSDKVQVIIAPPGSGGFIGNALLAGVQPAPRADGATSEATAEKE
ncbi:MAG: prohibitin family protein [Pelomonas sp.]|nr:prohibitin family protein [Roseateles sp.]